MAYVRCCICNSVFKFEADTIQVELPNNYVRNKTYTAYICPECIKEKPSEVGLKLAESQQQGLSKGEKKL